MTSNRITPRAVVCAPAATSHLRRPRSADIITHFVPVVDLFRQGGVEGERGGRPAQLLSLEELREPPCSDARIPLDILMG